MQLKPLQQIFALSLFLGEMPSAYASGDPIIILPGLLNLALLIASVVAVFKVRASTGIKILKGVLILAWLGLNMVLWSQMMAEVGILTLFLTPLILIPIGMIGFKKSA